MLEKICIHITHGYLSKMSFRILLSTAKMQIGTKYIKETLNAFTPTRVLLFFLFFECILSGRGIQNDRGEAGERAEAIPDKNGQVERQKMAGGDGYTSQKWLGQWHRQRGQFNSVSNIVASFCWSFYIPPVVISKVISSFPRTKFVMQVFMFFFSEK